jgi:hypothetical protein
MLSHGIMPVKLQRFHMLIKLTQTRMHGGYKRDMDQPYAAESILLIKKSEALDL